MDHTQRELDAARRLTDALLEFGLALAEGHRERAGEREQARRRAQALAEERSIGRGRATAELLAADKRLLLSPLEAAKYLSISRGTLFNKTAPRGPIPAVRIGTLVRYEVSDLKNAVLSMKQHQQKDPP